MIGYCIFRKTKEGKEYLKKPKAFPIVKDNEFEDDDDSTNIKNQGGTSAADDVLFSILKDLRKKLSKKLEIPPFVIFQDPSLADMALQYPITLEELKYIQGVGEGKAKRYGKEFVELIKSYVEENEIDRPQDMVVKSVANKSKLKVGIIQSIDRKISLDDIADSKGIDMKELISELEAIVNSGTKINIDYYLDEVLDEDHQEEIYEYFREAEDDSIDSALKELGEDDYSEDDIRLMRIRFFSEMGN